MTTLDNIENAVDQKSLARERRSRFDFRSVPVKLSDEMTNEGWTVDRRNRNSIRFKREKTHDQILEDRVWSLFYDLGFLLLSGRSGAKLTHTSGNLHNQLDVVALDDETAIVVECKSSIQPSKRSGFQGEVAKLAQNREPISRALREDFGDKVRRRLGLIMFLSNSVLTETDISRADQNQIVIFTDSDLKYYEDLTTQIGKAARYQFLADVFQGKDIPGLEVKIPAIKSKMAGHICYSFSISPEYLLKIGYVSHRSKGKASDVDSYQRMIKKSRLKDIKEYIESGSGVFPTNIVVNFQDQCRFDRTSQEGTTDIDVLGWLTIKPHYKFAWIIDGQHRLFAYADSERASSSRLTVLAFENLPASDQAQLFVDINAKQKERQTVPSGRIVC